MGDRLRPNEPLIWSAEAQSLHCLMKKQLGFLKTTAIGGLFFLLPLIVIGALIGQVIPLVLVVAEFLHQWLPFKTPAGIALLIMIAILLILLACFVAGIAARRSIAKRFANSIEKNLRMVFPRYVILKEQMSGTIGGNEHSPRMKPVLVRFNDALRIAFEVERTENGLVTVYLPGAPDPWSGSVVYMTADRVERLEIDFGDALAANEQLGRESRHLLAGFEDCNPHGDALPQPTPEAGTAGGP